MPEEVERRCGAHQRHTGCQVFGRRNGRPPAARRRLGGMGCRRQGRWPAHANPSAAAALAREIEFFFFEGPRDGERSSEPWEGQIVRWFCFAYRAHLTAACGPQAATQSRQMPSKQPQLARLQAIDNFFGTREISHPTIAEPLKMSANYLDV